MKLLSQDNVSISTALINTLKPHYKHPLCRSRLFHLNGSDRSVQQVMFWGAPCCLALCMESVQWIGLFWPILWPKTEPAGRRAVSTACTVCHVLQLFLRKALEVAVTWNLFMWLMSRDSFHLNARTQCFPGKSVVCASPVSGFNVGANRCIMIMLFFDACEA